VAKVIGQAGAGPLARMKTSLGHREQGDGGRDCETGVTRQTGWGRGRTVHMWTHTLYSYRVVEITLIPLACLKVLTQSDYNPA
jgi:hypothetical protein